MHEDRMPGKPEEPIFSMRPLGFTDVEEHCRLLRSLSNYQVPQNPHGNEEWLRNRRAFDESERRRRHYVAVHTPTYESVGYASLEQQAAGLPHYRMFLVFDPHRWAYEDLGDTMYQRLLLDAQDIGAKTLVLVEYANDLPFLNFLEKRGFVEVHHFLYDGFPVVRLEQSL